MSRTPIYTMGYEGLDIYEFLTLLASEPIEVLVDVRWRPISRKHGFSKTALAAVVVARGLQYVHMPQLGGPPDLRRALKESDDWGQFAMDYTDGLSGQTPALENLEALMSRSTAALLCYEADVDRCHRSLLVYALTTRNGGELPWRDLSKHGLRVKA